MTSGKTILIIAIIIVALLVIGIFVVLPLVALVAIGTFNGNPLGTACIATPGFTCQVVQYALAGGSGNPPAGNILVIIGQDSGTTWSTANVYFVNASQEAGVLSDGLTGVSNLAAPNTIVGGLASGVTTTVTLPAASSNIRVGSELSGYIWVTYTTKTNSSVGLPVQAQIASVSAKAT
jgi:hypothetical protein